MLGSGCKIRESQDTINNPLEGSTGKGWQVGLKGKWQ